jgi:Putative amidoligase enzyme
MSQSLLEVQTVSQEPTFTCATCETTVAEVYSPCDECSACCEHVVCSSCDERVDADDICRCCDACRECCTCYVCSSCDERVEEVCNNCEACDGCCTCEHCTSCDRAVESICGCCECCERHCECWYCEGCGEAHGEYTDRCMDCERCTETCACEQGPILPYETNALDYVSFTGKPEGGLYLGVELEVEVKGGDAGDKAEAWRDSAEDFLICKRDGSLHNGFEIVTAPADLPTHRQEWTRLLSDAALTRGLTSWDTSTCGMHVHVSRAPISALTLGKILVFMNHEDTHKEVVALAGRDATRWAKYYGKKVTDSVKRDYGGKLVKNYGTDRYDAVNLSNKATIEFRIFKGTLKLQHVLANIEFCDAVVRFCMQCSIADCASWAALWAYVTADANKKRYSNLIAYREGE